MTKQGSFKSRKAGIMKELEAFLGEDNLSDNPAVRSSYRWSWGFDIVVTPPGKGPEIVVMPRTVEQVQGIVKLANKEKLKILPVTGSTMAPNFDADILLDMSKMDRIIKIDAENSYVVVEPGVTYNRLEPLIEKEGYTIAHGSFQPSLMVAGYHGVQQGFFHNFGGRLGSQCLGIEVVTLDGTLLRTGPAAFVDDYWPPFVWEVPDIRGLFKGTINRTPLMGIVTKAAVRMWPVMEARGLPIGGFDSYGKAAKYCQAVVKAGIADQSMVWSWVLAGFHEFRYRGGKDDIDFLTHRMTHDYSEPYPGMYYCYTWTQFRGYKEQVDVNIKLCERIAKEMGGKILTDAALEDTVPNCWKTWKDNYRDFVVTEGKKKHLWLYAGGEGSAVSCLHSGHISDLIKLEPAFNQRIKEKYHLRPQPYYSRMYEGGVGGQLRYMLVGDAVDEGQVKRFNEMGVELGTWVTDTFPNLFNATGPKQQIGSSLGLGSVIEKISDALDPNHIGYRPSEGRLEPEED